VNTRVLVPGDEKGVDALLAAHADSSLFLRRNLAAAGLADGAERRAGAARVRRAGLERVGDWGLLFLQTPTRPTNS
jgi:hypothetical protein